jgi:ribosomal protein L39E
MAKNKQKKFKDKLVKEKNKNKRAPIWVTLRTKSREFVRSRRRNWRLNKMGLRTMHKKKAARLDKHRNPKYR